jgi:Tfp pilus assembly protein FimT
MVIVMVIAAIMVGVAAPALMRMAGVRGDEGDATPLAALLRSARRQSVEGRVIASLYLDPETRRYRVDTAGPGGAGLLAEDVLEMDPGVTLANDSLRVQFIFRPDGSVFGDTLMVHGQWGSSRVSVDRWTGAIRVEAW